MKTCLFTKPSAVALVITAGTALSAHAESIQVFARDGRDVGSGSTNPANSTAWGNPDENGPPYFSKAANAVGTVLTELVADDGTGNGTPARFTYHITDTATGADFTIDQVVYAMAGTLGASGSYSPHSMRTYSQVDGPSDNRNRTEFVTSGAGHEYWRTSFDLDSIRVDSGHVVTFVSWDQVEFKAIDGGVTGKIVASGGTNDPGAGASLFDFSDADSGATVSLAGGAGVSAIDWVPTSGAAALGFQSQGWVATFEVAPPSAGTFPLTITPSATAPGSYDFRWDSLDGKLYDLVSSTDLSTAPDTWPAWDGRTDLPGTPPTNLLADVAGGGDTRRFFAVVEKDPPPLFSRDFEEDDGGFIAINHSLGGGTSWEHGAPESTGLGGTVDGGNDGSANCWGTGNGNPGFYATGTDTSLISPVIDLTGVPDALLSFAEAIDILDGDSLVVNVIDPDIGAGITVLDAAIHTSTPDADNSFANWATVSDVAVTGGRAVRLEWRFTGDNDGSYIGAYIDDVVVTEAP